MCVCVVCGCYTPPSVCSDPQRYYYVTVYVYEAFCIDFCGRAMMIPGKSLIEWMMVPRKVCICNGTWRVFLFSHCLMSWYDYTMCRCNYIMYAILLIIVTGCRQTRGLAMVICLEASKQV